MALYKPPTRVTTRAYTYLALVSQADPDFQRKKHREIEYEFDHKVFVADPYVRGPYNDNSNVYAVGQPFGGLDAVKVAAKAPTAGVPTPGLFVGTPDGKGWA
jgi:hypothetical protein